jgi:membrane-associated protease RseP (regulator of RpoE activity)
VNGEKRTSTTTVAVITGIIALFLGLCLGAMLGGLSGYLIGRSTAPKTAPVIRPTSALPRPGRITPTPTPRGGRPGVAPTATPEAPSSGPESPPANGALIQEVVEGSPAAAANLRRNDVVTKVEGTPIDANHRLADLVAQYKPGDTVRLTVWRAGNTRVIRVTVGAHPDDPERAYMGVRYSDLAPPQRTPQPGN